MAMASAFGWSFFPPCDLRLRWTGREVEIFNDGCWSRLESLSFGEEQQAYWDTAAPPDLKGRLPHVIQRLFVPGIVQIWTGYFVSSAPGWSILVRPLPNIPGPETHFMYEGVVETDHFTPCPLFINIRLLKTDRPIDLAATDPLFCVQPVQQSSYTPQVLSAALPGMVADMDGEERAGLSRTIRLFDPQHGGDSLPGSYGAQVRRRRKSRRPETQS
jgi:hypothetical protein